MVSRNVPPQYVAGSDGNHGETNWDDVLTEVAAAPPAEPAAPRPY